MFQYNIMNFVWGKLSSPAICIQPRRIVVVKKRQSEKHALPHSVVLRSWSWQALGQLYRGLATVSKHRRLKTGEFRPKMPKMGPNSFIHSGHFYSAPSNPLLHRGAPDYSTDTVSELHAEAHRQLQVKDLPKVNNIFNIIYVVHFDNCNVIFIIFLLQ